MEFEDEENDFHGRVPEIGAIFMCNIATKRECLKKKVMGLPLAKANFVKQVKCGMVLFLFEFEKRELFGVYRAISNGGVNIVPHAFSSSGDCYPAQVRFTPIWDCSPLSEPEFRSAIRDNYYSARKFNFGLSEDQVRSLLMLFRTRKFRNKLPPRQFSRVINRRVGEHSNMVDDESPTASNGFPNQSCIEHSPVISYPNDFWDRENELNGDACSEGNRIEDEYRFRFSEGGCLNNNYRDSPGRRRMNDDGRILMNDIAGNSLNKDHLLTKRMRLSEGSQFLMDDKNLPSVMSSNDMDDPVPFIRKNGGTLFTNRERIVNQSNVECGSGMIRLTESYGKLSNDCTSTLATRCRRSLLNDGSEELYNPDYTPAVSGNFDSGNILRNANGQHRLIHDSTEHKHLKDYADVSTFPSTHFGRPSRDTDKLCGDAGSPVGWNRREHSTFEGPGFHSRRSEYFHSLVRDRRVHENTIEYDLGPSASNEQSAFRLNVDEEWANADWYRKNNPENAASLVENFHIPTHLIGGDPHTEMKQISPASCSMSFYETALPRITEAAKFDTTFSKFQEATITRALPCDHEYTTHCGFSSSSQVDHGSSLVQNNSLSVRDEQNLDEFLKDISMSYHEKVGASMGLPDFAADHRQRTQPYLQSRIGESHLNAEFSENIGLNATSSMVYRASPSSRPYMAFSNSTGPGEATLHGEYDGYAPLAIDSSTVSSLGIKERVALQESDRILYHGGVPITDHKNNFDIYETIAVNDGTACNRISELSHSDRKKSKRRSVFTRLSSKGTVTGEVMGMPQNQASLSKKQMKCKPLVKSQDNDEITIHGKHALVETDHNPSMISSLNNKRRNVHQPIEQNVLHAQQKTRGVDFKRRSEIKKSLHDSDTKEHLISIEMMSSESSVVKELLDTPPKHRKLTKDLISEEKIPSESQIAVKEPADKLANRRKLVRPVSIALISDEKMPIESEIVVKEPADKLANRRKLVRPVSIDLISDDKIPSESEIVVKEPADKLAKHKKLGRPVSIDLISDEKIPSESEVVVKEAADKLAKRKKLVRPVSIDLISDEKMPSGSEILVKEPADKLAKRRKLVRPVFGKSDVDKGTHHNPNAHVLNEAFNDDAKFVKARQHNATPQDIGSINELPSSGSGQEHIDANKKQSFNSVLKNSSDPHDSSSRDLDGNTTSQDNGSNMISSSVVDHNDPNLKQSFDCGNKRPEMLNLLIKDADVKNIGKPSQSVPVEEADSEVSPDETPTCITGISGSGTRDSATSEAAKAGHPPTRDDKLLGAENVVSDHPSSCELKSDKVT